ncbi:Six-bladed beta-propeller [Fusarium albosuccineum]|uniref:Six-bladed beta-propeller n=1 Tax=Fusarium albosuccineum TaxID=1237068 RepID=A0A8H4PJ50_9HYPO|nr:Six-bladed beta-propeller [Fusarium albosuccineum]
MALGRLIGVVVLAAIAQFVYERAGVLSLFYKNVPARLPRINTFGSHEILFEDKMRSCEDALLIEEHHLAIIACDAGRERWNAVMGVFVPGDVVSADIWAYDYTKPSAEALTRIKVENFASAQDFHSLGLAYDQETSTLFVASHAKAGPRIELFKLDIQSLTATHIRTVQHPLLHAPNAIALINSKEFYVSNAHAFPATRNKILNLLETYLSPPTGTVVHVSLEDSEPQAQVVAKVPFANGIHILNSTTIAVSATSRASVWFFNTETKTSWKQTSTLRLPFLPDNLSESDGKLLITGHPFVPLVTKFAHTSHICNDPKELERADQSMKDYCATRVATSQVSEWSEAEGLKHLYIGTEYPTSCTAVRDAKRGVGIVTGLYANGILVWKDSK